MESQPQESTLLVEGVQIHHPFTQIEERLLQPLTFQDDPDQPGLIHHKETSAAIAGVHQSHRRGKPLCNPLKPDPRGWAAS